MGGGRACGVPLGQCGMACRSWPAIYIPCLLADRQLLLHPRGKNPEKRRGPSKGRSRTSWACCRSGKPKAESARSRRRRVLNNAARVDCFQISSVIARRSESNNWWSSCVTCLSAACMARYVKGPEYAVRRIVDLAIMSPFVSTSYPLWGNSCVVAGPLVRHDRLMGGPPEIKSPGRHTCLYLSAGIGRRAAYPTCVAWVWAR